MKHALLLASFAVLTSCANFDLGYRKLEPLAETNPRPDAIVGMWHRKATDGWGLQLRQSFLFNRDGTGMDSYYHSDFLIGEDEQNIRFTWTYAGGGVWKTQSTDKGYEGSRYSFEWRMSQGKLIRKGSYGTQEVLERVSQ